MWRRVRMYVICVLVFVALCEVAKAGGYGTIVIHRKSRFLEFVRNDSIVFAAPVRVGKRNFPTPLGCGYIGEKRNRPIFRFVDPGPKQGQLVDSAECAGGKVRVNYKKMRALMLHYDFIFLPRKIVERRHLKTEGEERFSIHSVTCSETIGQAISKGCVGISIPDMLKLFEFVRADPTGIRATQFRVVDD
ncbi:MAG: L,D-transpeptidase [Patescibacteria group bacterium]